MALFWTFWQSTFLGNRRVLQVFDNPAITGNPRIGISEKQAAVLQTCSAYFLFHQERVFFISGSLAYGVEYCFWSHIVDTTRESFIVLKFYSYIVSNLTAIVGLKPNGLDIRASHLVFSLYFCNFICKEEIITHILGFFSGLTYIC